MSRSVKLVLYLIAVAAVGVFGWKTVQSYRQATITAQEKKARLERVAEDELPVPEVTNALEVDTNVLVAAVTNGPATNAAPDGPTASQAETSAVARTSRQGYISMVTYGLGLLLAMIGLAVLIAHDVSHYLGQRVQQALFNDEGQPVDPEYEKAEQLWADGHHLDAVRAMREYLNKHPREQYVALRIAEIYEQNLRNPLAAALEYEEVLKKNLPPERWGWAAIHLANLYSGKLNKPEQAVELLRRIDAEYGQTAAAKKARERLTQIDPTFVPAAVEQFAAQQGSDSSSSNLPPGFRPKS